MTVRFLAHACCECILGDVRIVSDPWLTGPAFVRGWWLVHRPPDDWLNRLATADLIYISHSHSDHLNIPTLQRLAERRADAPIVVPQFETDHCERMVRKAGLTNVRSAPFNEWVTVGKARLMILRDASTRDDSGALIEYKGHRILNTVDCGNLNNGGLPTPVDMLMTSFAGGASGFPVCWSKLYSEDEIARLVRRNRNTLRQSVLEIARQLQPRIYMPCAGYFTEAHPSDADIKRLNIKNSPMKVAEDVSRVSPGTIGWIPSAGSTIDISNGEVEEAHDADRFPIHDFARYTQQIAEDAVFEPLNSDQGVLRYFEWAGYREELILHVVETDDIFENVERELLINLSGPHLLSERPGKPHRYLWMQVRSDVFRHVLRRTLSWEEISIGFNARFWRDPDHYNMDFWEHFQNHLPDTCPWD